MPIKPLEYDLATSALRPVLKGFPGKISAIDGRDGSGKTTLSRYLSYFFNVSLIETDLFLIKDSGLSYHLNQIERILQVRLAKPLPVIIEGLLVHRVLKSLSLTADFSIHVVNSEHSGSYSLANVVSAYEAEFQPQTTSNLVLNLTH